MNRFRYCPKCAGELVYDEKINEGHATCQQCGYILYENPAPTVSAVIVNEKGDVLLTKRAREPFIGEWDLPGGFLQAGESLTEGLIRELREELNIEISIDDFMGGFPDTYGDEQDATINFFYLCRIVSGEPKPRGDVAAIEWVTPLEALKRTIFSCCKAAIQTGLTDN